MRDIRLVIKWTNTGRHGLELKASYRHVQMHEGDYVRGGAIKRLIGEGVQPWIVTDHFPKPIENILITMLTDVAAILSYNATGDSHAMWTTRLAQAMCSLGYDVWKWPYESENPEWDDNTWFITPTIKCPP